METIPIHLYTDLALFILILLVYFSQTKRNASVSLEGEQRKGMGDMAIKINDLIKEPIEGSGERK